MPHLAGSFLEEDMTTDRAFGGTVHVLCKTLSAL